MVPKVIYSQLSSESLITLISTRYPNLMPVSCKFYARGLHDNYLVENHTTKFILRIYRHDWRDTHSIQFELELLAFLRAQNTAVSSPIPNSEGELGTVLDFHEGERIVALFDFADGHLPEKKTLTKTSESLGHAVATMHLASTDFVTEYTRPVLDLPYLLDDSLVKIKPFLDSKQISYVKTLQKRIHSEMPTLPHEDGAFGICSGDINFRNFHINENNSIVLFDFDQCGYGLRAFELGKFLSSMHSLPDKALYMEAFLSGYQGVRPLSKSELQAIPYFEMVSIIWVLTIYIDNADRIGHILMDATFWKQRVNILKNLERNLARP